MKLAFAGTVLLALVSSLPERTGAGRYSPYRPAGLFAVIGSIAANVQAVTGPAPQPDPAVQSAPAPSGDHRSILRSTVGKSSSGVQTSTERSSASTTQYTGTPASR